MTPEEILKALMLQQYGSVLAFSKAAGIPNSTIRNIFDRGISGVSVTTALKICKMLNYDLDALLDGAYATSKQRPSNPIVNDVVTSLNQLNERDCIAIRDIVHAYCTLNDEGREKILDNADDLVRTGKYKKSSASQLGHKQA